MHLKIAILSAIACFLMTAVLSAPVPMESSGSDVAGPLHYTLARREGNKAPHPHDSAEKSESSDRSESESTGPQVEDKYKDGEKTPYKTTHTYKIPHKGGHRTITHKVNFKKGTASTEHNDGEGGIRRVETPDFRKPRGPGTKMSLDGEDGYHGGEFSAQWSDHGPGMNRLLDEHKKKHGGE